MTAADHEVIVVGAGTSGLAVAAMLRKRGIDSLILERSERIAESWRGRYNGLRLNTLGWMSRQPGLRPGWGWRGFPSRDRFVEYLERYAEHHRSRFQFGTEVRRLDPEAGGWKVETSDGTLRSQFAVVATGYDLVPKLPDVPGRESYVGLLVHSAEFRNAADYAAEDVLVVSAGVTGATHPNAPGLFFVGYVATLGGHLRGIRLESAKLARALARQRKANDGRPGR
ncbi:MAG: flavin-containing monooxygenase [Gaiellaceae bacterium]